MGNQLTTLKIEETDIFLDDQGNGRGKITISNSWGYNFSYFWGSMGSSLNDFLCGLDEGYFLNKLCNNSSVFCGKSTARNIRREMRSELSFELPWFKHMEFQKEMRAEVKKIESIDSDYEFVGFAQSLADNLPYYLIDCKYDRKEVESAIQSFFSEPWHYIGNTDSNHAVFLKKLFLKLKEAIKKEATND